MGQVSATLPGDPLRPASNEPSALNDESLFTPITEGPMFDDEGPFETSFWVDYDNDGFLDLFLTGGFWTNPTLSGFRNALYRNMRDGTFEKAAEGLIQTATTNAGSQSWGDYDNDGYPDVFIAQWGFRKGVLLRNSGNGSFALAAHDQQISDPGGPLAVWADFNADGFLDLSGQTRGRNVIFSGSPETIFSEAHFLNTPGGWHRSAADYDNDGMIDLIINTAPEGRLALYRNSGNGVLQRVTTGAIASQAPGFFGMAWGDYDNDGFLDLFAARGTNGDTVLFHNERDGTFRRVNNSGIPASKIGYNPHWVDFDNDGFLDLFVTGNAGLPSSLYRNNGDSTFSLVTTGSVATDIQTDPYGSAWGDYDHNGFMDLFVPNQGGPHRFYRNNGNGNAWIQFKLVGTASNRSGIGAKIRVLANVGGKDTWQLREWIASEGYDGAGTLRAEFGLGNAARIELVRIEWPSGTVQEFRDVVPRQILTVTEPSRLADPTRNADGSVQFSLIGAVGIPFQLEVSTDLRAWTQFSAITNKARVEVILDTNTVGGLRFYRAAGPAPLPFTQ